MVPLRLWQDFTRRGLCSCSDVPFAGDCQPHELQNRTTGSEGADTLYFILSEFRNCRAQIMRDWHTNSLCRSLIPLARFGGSAAALGDKLSR